MIWNGSAVDLHLNNIGSTPKSRMTLVISVMMKKMHKKDNQDLQINNSLEWNFLREKFSRNSTVA